MQEILNKNSRGNRNVSLKETTLLKNQTTAGLEVDKVN
jgi:hypothetical protein